MSRPFTIKKPLVQKPKPDRPFQEIAVDFCSYAGCEYLIIVDCYTDWPAILSMDHGATTLQLITALRQSFCQTAIPDILWSDGGPQFTSKQFRDFSHQWGFLHKVSTPHYPQTNGKIKATVKSMKKIIRTSWNGRFLDHDKFCCALLQYRNTPSKMVFLQLQNYACPRHIASSSLLLLTRMAAENLRVKTRYYVKTSSGRVLVQNHCFL